MEDEEIRISRFKTVGEKHLFSEIDLMLWSPKVDLVAMTTTEGEVVLYRINWQKVWSHTRLEEGVLVSALAWRPDGKVLAVGYTNGRVRLFNIEGGFCLHDHNLLSHKITMLKWISEMPKEENLDEIHKNEQLENFDSHNEEIFLPKLPPITNKEEGENNKSTEDFKQLKDQKLFNLLLLGTQTGVCQFFAYGIISIGKLDSPSTQLIFHNMFISADLKCFLTVFRENSHFLLSVYNSENLQANQQLLQQTALKLGKLETLLGYLDEVLAEMSEVLEDILVEIESKLMKFAETKPNRRSLSFEFLRLLLYGFPSDDLKHFLQYELTKQAFSKLGRSVQASYRNIQMLLIKNLNTVCHNIVYHLKDLLANSRCNQDFKRLGLEEDLLTECMRGVESVMFKGREMVAVIEASVRNFNAFYRWLYPTKVKLSGESAVLRMNQQEVLCVAQFLRENFDTTMSKLKLEKLGQYLKDEDLTVPMEGGLESHGRFMDSMSQHFKHHTRNFFPSFARTKSLVQLTKKLRNNFQNILEACSSAMMPFFFKYTHQLTIDFAHISPSLELSNKLNVSCFDGPYNPHNNNTCFLSSSSSFYMAFLISPSSISILKTTIHPQHIQAVNLAFQNSHTNTTQEILEFSFFDDNTITLLLTDDNTAKLFLLDLSNISHLLQPLQSTISSIPTHNLSEAFSNSKQCKDLSTFKPACMSINGQRKIGTVASVSRKWIQLYLIDSDDEGDGDDGDDCMEGSSVDHLALNPLSGAIFEGDDKENNDVYE